MRAIPASRNGVACRAMQHPRAFAEPQCKQPDPSSRLPRTPGLPIGPYYPVQRPAFSGADLWSGGELPGGARRLVLDGTCCRPGGEPVAGVLVELWHADPWGRYPHASDPGGKEAIDGFTGYGRAVSDEAGAFSFRSVVPGGYEDQGTTRAPHLHLQFTGAVDRVATQLFLPAADAHRSDRWFAALRHPELLLPRVLDGTPGSLHLAWTAVLTTG